MDYARVEKFILDLLKKKLSDKLYYHNVCHTCETIKAAAELGRAEGLPEEEITILKTAALFHDTGLFRLRWRMNGLERKSPGKFCRNTVIPRKKLKKYAA